MIKHKTAILVSIALVAGSASGPAQDTVSSGAAAQARAVSADAYLDALVAEALRNNPDAAAASHAADAARLRIEPARALPDPTVSVNYQNDGRSPSLGSRDMTFVGAMFSQPLPWPGKLKLAGDEARSRADEAAEGPVRRAAIAIEARVRRAYYDFLLAREELGLVEDRARSWREIADIVRERYAVGLGVQQDVLRAQVEVLRLDEARMEQNARVANRRAELNRVLGRAQDAPIETPARLVLREDLPDLAALLPAVRDRSPELAGSSRGIESARLRADLAKKSLLPDFVASGGPMYRGGLDPMWQVGVAISLPVYAGTRQRPLIAAAQADVRTEEARASSLRQEL
ncbi:MAG TPA: TolC family protein, partial [Thermoanaerobaculia bacterium]